MKYIDAEKLIHDLEERIFAYSEGYAEGDDCRKDAIETLLKDVRYQCFLQQEQPEVDLNAEIEKELRLHYNDDQDVYWWNYLKNSFRHFYELGLKQNDMNREQIINQYISVYEGHAMEKEELEIMLNGFADDIVNNLQPSLPSNLDEAAETYSKEVSNGHSYRDLICGFKAGAEWMEKEINKELIKAMEKVHEIRDVDYDVHVIIK